MPFAGVISLVFLARFLQGFSTVIIEETTTSILERELNSRPSCMTYVQWSLLIGLITGSIYAVIVFRSVRFDFTFWILAIILAICLAFSIFGIPNKYNSVEMLEENDA